MPAPGVNSNTHPLLSVVWTSIHSPLSWASIPSSRPILSEYHCGLEMGNQYGSSIGKTHHQETVVVSFYLSPLPHSKMVPCNWATCPSPVFLASRRMPHKKKKLSLINVCRKTRPEIRISSVQIHIHWATWATTHLVGLRSQQHWSSYTWLQLQAEGVGGGLWQPDKATVCQPRVSGPMKLKKQWPKSISFSLFQSSKNDHRRARHVSKYVSWLPLQISEFCTE